MSISSKGLRRLSRYSAASDYDTTQIDIPIEVDCHECGNHIQEELQYQAKDLLEVIETAMDETGFTYLLMDKILETLSHGSEAGILQIIDALESKGFQVTKR